MAQPPVSPYSKSAKTGTSENKSPKTGMSETKASQPGAGASHTQQPNNPLHGVKLETIVTKLVEHYGWSGLHDRVRVNCFAKDPSVKSSLKFLRKTQWARDKVEALYIDTFC